MSNVIKILLIILLFLIIGSLSVFLFFVITGKIELANFGFGESTTLVDEKEVEEAKSIKVKAKTANVYIKHSTNDKFKAEIYSDNAKEYSIKLDDNKNFIIELEDKKMFLFKKSPKIVLYVPSTYESDITIETKTGDIESDSFDKAIFDIHVTTGDITLGKVNNANIECTTGDIEIDTVNDLKSKTTTGDVKINNVLKHIDINSTTGDVKIDNITLVENSNIKATTGDVKIDHANDIYIDASAKTGDIKIQDNNRHSEIELKIQTTTGDIRVG